MLNFIFWGVTLNCYAFTTLVLIVRALFPNGLQKKAREQTTTYGDSHIHALFCICLRGRNLSINGIL